MEVQTASVIEKADDALNVAIVFHQHQPYYKNKLTGMYELPWVRVHAMTEYVDSPGILAQYPDTKVTYNLVPSFLEQLTDYHRNETADVHTDFARRDWPTNADGSVAGYPNATALELHTMQFQSFWNSGWIYNVSEDDPNAWVAPASERYKELYDATLHNLKPATIMDDELLSRKICLTSRCSGTSSNSHPIMCRANTPPSLTTHRIRRPAADRYRADGPLHPRPGLHAGRLGLRHRPAACAHGERVAHVQPAGGVGPSRVDHDALLPPHHALADDAGLDL